MAPPTTVPATATLAPPTPTGAPPTQASTATAAPNLTATPQPPEPTPIRDNNGDLSAVCTGDTVTVSGNKLTLDLTGVCKVVVTGNNNRITVPAGTPVEDRGNNNVIIEK